MKNRSAQVRVRRHYHAVLKLFFSKMKTMSKNRVSFIHRVTVCGRDGLLCQVGEHGVQRLEEGVSIGSGETHRGLDPVNVDMTLPSSYWR